MEQAFRYDLFGAGLLSNRPLESVPPSGLHGPAAPLRVGVLPAAPAGRPVDALAPHIERVEAGGFRIRFADETCFVLDAGGGVWFDWPVSLTQRDAEAYLLGPIAGLHARLRGRVALHASVVEIGGQAVAFAGDSGSGKSTLAAAFARAGHRVLSDDLLVLETEGGSIQAVPGYPGVRLWGESVAALYGATDALPQMTPGWEKRYLDLTAADLFQRKSLPLGAICVLTGERGPDPRMERIRPAEALVALSGHAQGSRILTPESRRHQFSTIAEVARRVPVWSFSAPEHAALAKFCEAPHVFHC